MACGAIFTTRETIDYSASIVVRKKQRLEPFERDKLFVSLIASVSHRSDALGDAAALTTTITQQLLKTTSDGSIDAVCITKTTQDVLRRFDSLAAAYYSAHHAAKYAKLRGAADSKA
ncbi:hypothetical protein CSA80_04200 [Candidatus Saccharibacteria bacterium]|nr:MAG: hypothetical protein CR973_01725 [Candidatus Saccharibacteria bacterium]PID98875.1 MAG: hypothetical protein CSA80_04200 [Candidatus Saccharibacteria bacterium]